MSSSIGKPNVSKPAPAGKKPAGDKKPAGPPAAVVAEAKKVKGDAPKAAAALAKAFANPDDAAFWLLSEVADAKLAPWILANYAAVLEACGSKKGPVKAAAKAALAACVPVLPAEAAPLELPCLFKAMAVEQQWPARVAAGAGFNVAST